MACIEAAVKSLIALTYLQTMMTASSLEPEYETCRRCNGKGTITIRLGEPADTHASYVDVEWGEANTFDCSVCLGVGRVRIRQSLPIYGEFHVHSEKASQMSFEEIFDAMRLPTGENNDSTQVSP